MAPAPPGEWGFFPLDEEVALQPGSLPPHQQEHLGHLGSWMPFEQAAKMREGLLGLQVSEALVRRHTQATGACALMGQTAKKEAQGQAEPEASSAARLAVRAEGASIPLLKGEGAEVRTVASGEVEPEKQGAREQEVHAHPLSSFSRMTDAATLADLAEVEMRRRRRS